MTRPPVYRCTIRQLAAILGITRMGAHKAETKATVKLHKALEREFAKDWSELNGEGTDGGAGGTEEGEEAAKGKGAMDTR